MKKALAIMGIAAPAAFIFFLLSITAALVISIFGVKGIMLDILGYGSGAILTIMYYQAQKEQLDHPFEGYLRDSTPPEVLAWGKEVALAAGIDCPPIYIIEDDKINAYTAAEKLYITAGALQLSPKQIQAMVAHEIGHIVEKHEFWQKFRAAFAASTYETGNRMLSNAMTPQSFGPNKRNVVNPDTGKQFCQGFLGTIAMVLGGIGYNICTPLLKEHEFRADAFAAAIGYGDDLCGVLSLWSSHPPAHQRIARLNKLKQQEKGGQVGQSTSSPQPTEIEEEEATLRFTASLIRDLVFAACSQIRGVGVEDVRIKDTLVEVDIRVSPNLVFSEAMFAVEKEVREYLQAKIGSFSVRASIVGLFS